MKSFKIYRILSFILLPFGALMALNALSGLFVALTNPLLLIVSFIMACVPLYIFTSSYFFFKGVLQAKPCKASLKEWIKANAVVSIIFGAIMFLCALMILALINNPAAFIDAMKQMPANQQQGFDKITMPQKIRLFKTFAMVMLPLSAILIVHIVITFRMVKLYNHVFDKA
ncbi:MAG: hypothetical protein H7178_13610 [Chitinophagaceae bacterium]|nr:hypothetical protein [Chitinophagaceae bacterium]